jgi:putative flippase GtrA
MSGELTPRPSGRPSRRSREQRAFRLVVVGGTASVVAVVGLVLAIAGVVGGWLPVLAIIVAVACALLFRRTVGR